MIPKYQLQDLCSEAAKLKTLGAMESVPPDRLVRLLNILEKNIRDGTRVSPIADPVSVLGWGVMLYGLIVTSVEVPCHENAAFLMPMCKNGREQSYRIRSNRWHCSGGLGGEWCTNSVMPENSKLWRGYHRMSEYMWYQVRSSTMEIFCEPQLF